MNGLFFTHSQKKGLLILLALIFLLSLGRFLWLQRTLSPPANWPSAEETQPVQQSIITSFDINLADSAQWASLPGIGPVLSRRIIKFREAKGGFHAVADLQKVYGLKPEIFDQISDQLFVQKSEGKISLNSSKKRPSPAPFTPKSLAPINLNTADSATLTQLPGIGPVLSQRIIRFRKAKGGFEEVDELKQLYGLKPAVFDKIRPIVFIEKRRNQSTTIDSASERSPKNKPSPISSPIALLDLNKADSAQLEALPGIGPTLAKRILKYRNILGYYVTVEQLQQVYGLSMENYERMRPFLSVTAPPSPKRLDLNSAKTYSLKRIVGKELANVIIQQRQTKGWFDGWAEVAGIKGVDQKVLQLLKGYFMLSD